MPSSRVGVLAMMPDSLERAQRIAETVLKEQLNDVVFDRVLVKPDIDRFDEDDSEYVAVKAIYEGRRERVIVDGNDHG